MKTNIGIDIDCTVFDTDTPILEYIWSFCGKMYDRNILNGNLEESLPELDKGLIKDAVDLAVARTDLEIYKGAKEVIQWLSKYYSISFITYRPYYSDIKREAVVIPPIHSTAKPTMTLLNRLEIPYEIVWANREDGKHDYIKRRDIKVFVEDDAKTIQDIVDKTDCVCLVYNQPWNKELEQSDQIIRVYNWNEIKNVFIIRGVGE